jgi:HlyD family secretion protein
MSLAKRSSDLRAGGRSRVELERALGEQRGAPRWLRWAVASVALLVLALGGMRFVRQRAQTSAPRYETARVERGDLQVTVSATGSLASLSMVEVGAEISGRVTRVYVSHNDRVEKGQLLAELDVEQLQASIDESSARVLAANAAIQQAEVTLAEAEANLTRAEALASKGAISPSEIEAARAKRARADALLAASRADARVARAATQSVKSKFGKGRIVSPIRGIVLSRLVEPGQTVTAGFQTPVLFRIAEDLRQMALHVYVDEADIGRVREGSTATFTVDAYPERKFPSRVLSIRNEPKTEQNVVTYEAVLSVDNSELMLRPGMTATATIVAESLHDVLLVPNTALRFAPPERIGLLGPPTRVAEGPRVWVLRDGVPEPVRVKRGPTDGQKTQILEGIESGRSVIVDAAGP